MRFSILYASNIICAFLLIISSACLTGNSKAQTPTETPTDTPSETPTETPTATPPDTPTFSPTRPPVFQTPVTPVPGYLQWPRSDALPNAGLVNSTFGEFRSEHFHNGIDIPGGEEQYALACVDGVILFRESQGSAGNVVGILDSNGYLNIYLHLSGTNFYTEFPPKDTFVSAGTPIARVGNTGISYGPHLHLEIRSVLPTPNPGYKEKADSYNPLSWLSPPWTPTPTSGNRPPYLSNLYVVPEGSGSGIWVKTPAPYMTPLPEPNKSIQIPLPFKTTPTPKVFHARGRLQFMLDAYDKINDPGSKCGVYDIGYKVSGENDWKYRIQFEEIPREFISKEELVFQKGPPAASHIGKPATKYIYRLFMPYSETPTPTPPMVIEAEPTNKGVFNTLDYPNGTPVVLRFEVKSKAIPGFPDPTPKFEEISIIPSNPDLWVDCDLGNDSMNDCSDPLNPCRTITHALDSAIPGDVIFVAPGFCQDTDGEVFPLNLKEGVTIEGSGYSYPSNGGTVVQSIESNPYLFKCEELIDPPVIKALWIVSGYSGVFIKYASPVIRDCQISAHIDAGIRCDVLAHPEIINCLIRNNGGAGISIINTEIENGVTIENCTITQNQDGIACLPHASALIRNNIVTNNGGYGLFINSPSEADLVEYSDFWNNSSGNWNLPPLVGVGVIYENPLFVSGTYGSYYLNHDSPVSPCIDSGSTTAASAGQEDKTTSILGWLDDDRVDMGFHHKVILPTDTPTPTEGPSETPSPTPSGPTSTPTTGPTQTPYPTDTPFPTAVAIEIFNEGFEGGFDGWQSDGLWRPASRNPASLYYTSYAEVAEGDVSFWYGQNASGDYDTGDTNSGSLTSPVIAIGDHSILMFSSWEQTEGTSAGLDTRKVYISIDYGETWTPIWASTQNASSYRDVVIDLGGYKGLPVQLRFEFDTVDGLYNEYRGWFIDNISIGLGPVPSTTVMGMIVMLVAMSLGLTVLRRK